MTAIAKLAGTYLNLLYHINKKKCATLGYKLCSYPSRPHINELQKQFLSSGKSESFNYDKLKLQTYRWGRGPRKIVFLHGWQSHTFRWKSHIESLSPELYSIYAFDAPGHGWSEGNLLNAPYYSAAIEKFLTNLGAVDTVIAHSIGAFAFLHAAHHHPRLNIAKAVIMASPTEAIYFMEFCQRVLGLSDQSLRLIQSNFEKEFQQSLHDLSAQKFVSTLSIPGLFIHDIDDDETPYENILPVHQKWKNSTLMSTRGLGHKLKSNEVIQAVLNFVQVPRLP